MCRFPRRGFGAEFGPSRASRLDGSRPVEIAPLPFGGPIMSSSEALSLDSVPQKLAVVGAGYIGLELGMAFAKLGFGRHNY